MNSKTIKLSEVKKYWLQKAIRKEMEANYSKSTVARFYRNINSIQERNCIVGYGSLLSEIDAHRTFPNMISHELVYIDGYERIFNFGKTHKGSWLNVRQNANSQNMPVSLIELNAEDMSYFYNREILYDSIDVGYYTERSEFDTDSKELTPAKMVLVTDKSKLNAKIEPMLTYLSLCIQGLANLGDDLDMHHFMNNTMCANGMSIGEWMENLNVKDYILSHTHQSR